MLFLLVCKEMQSFIIPEELISCILFLAILCFWAMCCKEWLLFIIILFVFSPLDSKSSAWIWSSCPVLYLFPKYLHDSSDCSNVYLQPEHCPWSTIILLNSSNWNIFRWFVFLHALKQVIGFSDVIILLGQFHSNLLKICNGEFLFFEKNSKIDCIIGKKNSVWDARKVYIMNELHKLGKPHKTNEPI